MNFYWRKSVYGWVMTGLVGRDGRWFFGFSRTPAHGAEGKTNG